MVSNQIKRRKLYGCNKKVSCLGDKLLNESKNGVEFTYQGFKTMMDSVGKDIVKHSKKPFALAYSGGIDSTAILLSLLNAKAKFYLVHERHENKEDGYGLYRERRASHMGRLFDLPVLCIPCSDDIWGMFAELCIEVFVEGDGMDRCYFEYYRPDGSTKHFSFGEPFRAKHPLFDMFFGYAPGRFSSYGIPRTYAKGDKYDVHDRIEKELSINCITYAYHPLFLEFFSNYKEDVKDIFFRKILTEKYVKDNMGMSFNSMVREVCRLNRSRFKPFGKRFFEYMEREKEKKRQV